VSTGVEKKSKVLMGLLKIPVSDKRT